MEILVLQDYLRCGGTENQSILLAKAFNESGHPTTLLTLRPGGALKPQTKGLRHLSLQKSDCHLNWFAPGLIKCIKSVKPDVVLCMGRCANSYAGYLQNRIKPACVVGTFRTVQKSSPLLKWSWARVSKIVANSRFSGQALMRMYAIAAQKIEVIPNDLVISADNSISTDQSTDDCKRFNLQTEKLVLLCIGMFRKCKNQKELIQILAGWKSKSNWALWFVGDGKTLKKCIKLTQKLGLDKNVRFFGYQSNPKHFYESAHIAVLTGQEESLPNFLCEAQSFGLPVVAYDVAGVGECFADQKSGFLIPNKNKAAFLNGLKKLAENKALLSQMSAEALRFSKRHFQNAASPKRYLELFNRMIQKRNKANRS